MGSKNLPDSAISVSLAEAGMVRPRLSKEMADTGGPVAGMADTGGPVAGIPGSSRQFRSPQPLGLSRIKWRNGLWMVGRRPQVYFKSVFPAEALTGPVLTLKNPGCLIKWSLTGHMTN